jgi:DNA-binding GntR family transcriptional regulator
VPVRTKAGRAEPTAVDRSIKEIRRRIRAGVLAPGQRLIEADLTRVLGVSRGRLREALSHLAAEGLVSLEPNRMTVRALTCEEVRNISVIREMLEGLAARLAAERVAAGHEITVFRRIWEYSRVPAARSNTDAYVEANQKFHAGIVSLSGNIILDKLIDQLSTSLYRFQFRSRLRSELLEQGHRDHEEVATAILAGDAEAAERAMRKHLRNSAKLILRLPQDAFG